MDTTQVFWYLARSAGFLTYTFAWASVVWGLLLTTRIAPRVERATLYAIHRLLGLGSAIFLGVHLATLFLDPWAKFTVAELLVPFVAHIGGVWTACGIIAMYALLVVLVSSLIQTRIPRRLWRGLHFLSFLTFGAGLAHGIGTGSDTDRVWAMVWYGLTAVAVLFLILYRVLWKPETARRPSPALARGRS